MRLQLELGRHVFWMAADSSASGEAVVDAIRNDQQEGLSPELEAYVALWAEVIGVQGFLAGQRFTFL